MKKIIFAWPLLFALFVLSCGKVTQESDSKKENPSFSVNYKMPVNPTENKSEYPDYITITDTLYNTILSMDKKGKLREEAWGKALVVEDEKAEEIFQKQLITYEQSKASGNVSEKPQKYPFLKAAPKDKKGIDIKSADHTLVKATLQPKDYRWEMESAKVRRGYDYYFLIAFKDKQSYRMTVLDKDTVSQNAMINANELTEYETFIALLQWADLHRNTDAFLKQSKLKTLFNEAFFKEIVFVLPENKVKEFKLKKPKFKFDVSIQKELLVILDYAVVDLKEANKSVQKLDNKIFTKEAKLVLMNSLKDYFKPEEEGSLSGEAPAEPL